MLDRIRWLGHASFVISGKPLIYIDPWKLEVSEESADLVLISHSHYDHFSKEDLAMVRSEETEVVCPGDVASELEGPVAVVTPGSRLSLGGAEVEVLPAYNVKRPFHPRSDLMLGFVVMLEGKKLYYAGDTDFTPEMAALTDIEVALLPVGGRFTMDAEEAAEAANVFRPRVAIPYHWGDIVGSIEDAERFARLFKGETRILEQKGRGCDG
jgi:L-ascorbate metabolism protein UlaG (beta-lactamase superfamily)